MPLVHNKLVCNETGRANYRVCRRMPVKLFELADLALNITKPQGAWQAAFAPPWKVPY